MEPIRIGMAGSGSIARTHADALTQIPDATITAVFSRSAANAKLFAEWKGADRYTDDWTAVADADDVDLVCVCLPNGLHAEVTLAALAAGKHAVVEKPLCLTIEQAEALAAAEAASTGRLFYAEELPFVPKFREARALIDQGAVGDVYFVRQTEKHAGPYSPWFFDRAQAGGGALADMGCHGIELIRWVLGDKQPERVSAEIDTYIHETELDDHALVTMRFPGGAIGVSESSWCLQGGMESMLEIHGTKGTIRIDLGTGSGVDVYSEDGYGMIPDKTRGWRSAVYSHDREWGYVGEWEHFLSCIRTGEASEEGTAQGRAVLEILLAAYESARTGRSVDLPFAPAGVEAPIDLWKRAGDR